MVALSSAQAAPASKEVLRLTRQVACCGTPANLQGNERALQEAKNARARVVMNVARLECAPGEMEAASMRSTRDRPDGCCWLADPLTFSSAAASSISRLENLPAIYREKRERRYFVDAGGLMS